MTHEEIEKRISEVAAEWASKYYPSGLINTKHNWDLIGAAAANRLMVVGSVTAEDVKRIVDLLTREGRVNGVEGRLLYEQPSGNIETTSGIPHQDIFPNVDTVEKCVKYIKTVKIPSENISKINELLAFLKSRNIRGKGDITPPADAKLIGAPNPNDDGAAIRGYSKAPAGSNDHTNDMRDIGSSSPIQGRHREVSEVDKSTPIGEALALLDSLGPKDVGNVKFIKKPNGQTGPDAAEQYAAFMRRIVPDVQSARCRNVPGEKILAYVKQEIAKLRSSSIR